MGGVTHGIADIKDKDGRNPAGDAIRQVLSWAVTLDRRTTNVPYLVLPVVVTTHPLYVTRLDNENVASSRPVDWVGVWHALPTDGVRYPVIAGCVVHIIREAGLDAFVAALGEISRQLVDLLRYPH